MGLAVALGVGLLLGLERERHKGDDAHRGSAGIRTFPLVALLGGLCVRVDEPAILAVGCAFVGLAALEVHVRGQRADPGLTTAVALVVAYLLGALAQDDAALAAGFGTGVAILLASRSPLHRLARDTLSDQEIHDVLLFAAAALIVLPLVPDRGIGPNEAFNPFTTWRLVVLVLAVNGLGYVAVRAVGPRYGLPLAGLLGGFASSTATLATMGRRAHREPALRRGAIAAGAMSTVASICFTALVVGAADPATLERLALPLALAGAVALAYGGAFAVRAARHGIQEEPEAGRPFDPLAAALIAGAISALLFVSAVMEQAFGRSGVLLTSAVAGSADAQAASASASVLATGGRISRDDAAFAVLLAVSSNTLCKAGVSLAFGERRYAAGIWPGLVLVLVAAWLGLLLG